jgi:hypothetical protein
MSMHVSEETILDALHKVPEQHWGAVLAFLNDMKPSDIPAPDKKTARWTIQELSAMPPDQRGAILERQAALAEHDYRSDPELAFFDAFGQDDLYVDDAEAPTR